MDVAPTNTLTVQVNIMFEEMEILNKNLQKGMERWLEQDLQQRGRTHEEMQEMTLNRPSERDSNLFISMIDSYFNTAFDELLERTCKELIQKWNHEGGKRDFAIGVILEMLKDQGQLKDEQALRTSLQNVDDWKIIKKLMGLAAFMSPGIFAAYTGIIEHHIKTDESTRDEIIRDIKVLLILQLGADAMEKVAPTIQGIDDLQELKQVFIAAARAPNLLTFKAALSQQQHAEKSEGPPLQQQ